jgi:hypothetical protein
MSHVVVVPRPVMFKIPMVIAASRLKSGQRVKNSGDLMSMMIWVIVLVGIFSLIGVIT